MNLLIHNEENISLAEVQSEEMVISEIQDALDVMVNAQYMGADTLIIHEHQLCPDFFELRTGIAGEILQKFSNYRMKLAIIGDFRKYSSKSLRDFIFESNKGGRILFLSSVDEAKKCFINKNMH